MEEKTIISGRKGKAYILLIISISLILLAFLLHALNFGGCRESLRYSGFQKEFLFTRNFINNLGFFFANDGAPLAYCVPIIFYIGFLMGIIGLIFMLAYRKVSITVTNKRVYGTASWSKRVDLPLDMISAVATSFAKGIDVSTSSGSIHFKIIENNKEIHEEISKLLMERQEKEKTVATTTFKQEIPQSNADELKKYKDLLDSGVITQEEFEAKKKQLLGL